MRLTVLPVDGAVATGPSSSSQWSGFNLCAADLPPGLGGSPLLLFAVWAGPVAEPGGGRLRRWAGSLEVVVWSLAPPEGVHRSGPAGAGQAVPSPTLPHSLQHVGSGRLAAAGVNLQSWTGAGPGRQRPSPRSLQRVGSGRLAAADGHSQSPMGGGPGRRRPLLSWLQRVSSCWRRFTEPPAWVQAGRARSRDHCNVWAAAGFGSPSRRRGFRQVAPAPKVAATTGPVHRATGVGSGR